jgi:magnesium-transporting ATPase (P-type)
LKVDELFEQLHSTSGGLTVAEAAGRLEVYGHNRIQAERRASPWKLLFEQFKNVLIITLLIATALSAFLGHGIEAAAIAVIVLFAVMLGFIQESMTMTFMSLVLIQFFKAYNFRSEKASIFSRPFANKWLNLAIVWELVMLAAIISLPVFRVPFGTFLLTAEDWAIVIVSAATVVPVIELLKWLLRRGLFEAGRN